MAVTAHHPNVSRSTLPRNNGLLQSSDSVIIVEYTRRSVLILSSANFGQMISTQVYEFVFEKFTRKTCKTCSEFRIVWDHHNTCWWAKTSSSGAGRRHHQQHYGEWQAKHEQPWFPRHGANPRSAGPSRHSKISFLHRKSSPPWWATWVAS